MSETESKVPAEVEPLPDVPVELEKKWALVEQRVTSDRLKQALRRIIAGESYREAAAAVGYSDHRVVFRSAKAFGLVEWASQTDRLIMDYRQVAHEANSELLKRLDEAPEKIPTRELTVMSGVSADKIRDYERWSKRGDQDGGGFASALAELAQKVAAGEIDLKLEVVQGSPDRKAIDVTPQEGTGSPRREF